MTRFRPPTGRLLSIGLIALLAGCGGGGGEDAGGLSDGGDAGARDASPMPDGGPGDAGSADAGAGDAGDAGGDDAGAGDAGATDAGSPSDAAGSPDTGAGTDACIPESDSMLCTAAAAECGTISPTDRCGTPRTVSCGDCTDASFLMCRDNACGCDAPPPITYLSCVADSLGVRFMSHGVEQLWWTWSRTGTLPSCGSSDYSLVSDSDLARGRVNMSGGPGLGECALYRLCARDSRCTSVWSTPVDVQFCVDGSGTMPTCSLR